MQPRNAFDNTPVIKGNGYFQKIEADITSEYICETGQKLREHIFKTRVAIAGGEPQDCLEFWKRLSLLVCWRFAHSNPQQLESTPWVSALAAIKCWTNILILEKEDVDMAVTVIGAKDWSWYTNWITVSWHLLFRFLYQIVGWHHIINSSGHLA